MIHGSVVVVVMPAYNAESTLARTTAEIPPQIADCLLLVDDASQDETARLAEQLGICTIRHEANRGYGANQKTCFRAALKAGAEVVVMLHPDYQYDPRLVGALAAMVASGVYDLAIGSRILGGKALAGGMPLYKYLANRCLTAIQNWCLGASLSEYHTGFRAFSRQVLESLPLDSYSDDFLFDNQILAEALSRGFRVGEISCPTRYFAEASSIGVLKSISYGMGVLKTCLRFLARGRHPRSVGMPHRADFASRLLDCGRSDASSVPELEESLPSTE